MSLNKAFYFLFSTSSNPLNMTEKSVDWDVKCQTNNNQNIADPDQLTSQKSAELDLHCSCFQNRIL